MMSDAKNTQDKTAENEANIILDEQSAAEQVNYREKTKEYVETASAKASEIASEAKDRTSNALGNLSNIIEDTAKVIDDNMGIKYGDYARSASQTVRKTSETLKEKQVDELADDARQFVRKSPALAIGIAAVAGFVVASLLRSGKK